MTTVFNAIVGFYLLLRNDGETRAFVRGSMAAIDTEASTPAPTCPHPFPAGPVWNTDSHNQWDLRPAFGGTLQCSQAGECPQFRCQE